MTAATSDRGDRIVCDHNADEQTLCRLAAAARGGDRASLANLLTRLQDVLWRFCLSQLGDRDAAEEAVQETATRLITSIGRFRGESTAKTWALGVALNVCRELRRRRKVAPLAEMEAEVVDNVTPVDRRASVREQAAALRQRIAQLPDRQREAVVLRYFEQLTVEQTALAMGCAAGTVKASLWQALRRLRNEMQNPRCKS